MSDTDWLAGFREKQEQELEAKRDALAAVAGTVTTVETLITVSIPTTVVTDGIHQVEIDQLQIRLVRFPGSQHQEDSAGGIEVTGLGHHLTRAGTRSQKRSGATVVLPQELATPYILDSLTKG
jgi:hypothetical protein